MQLSLSFEPSEIETVRTTVAKKLNDGRRLVHYRQQQNVDGLVPTIDDDALWTAHIMCLLTTQQRSGPGSSINRLLDQRPFPLALSMCRKQVDAQTYVFDLLSNAPGIRRTNRIAAAVQANLRLLERGAWKDLRHWSERLLEQRCLPPIHRSGCSKRRLRLTWISLPSSAQSSRGISGSRLASHAMSSFWTRVFSLGGAVI